MRTFVAVEMNNQDVLESIKNVQLEIKIKAKPVATNNMHFTLQFLGEVSEEMAAKIQDALNSIKFSSFDIIFQNMGAFPKPSFPRVIWIGTDDEGGGKLVELANKVGEVLYPLGFEKDKPFKPHVTIFRIKNKVGNISDELKKYSSKEFGIQKVSEIKFKKSVLTPSGPQYSDIQVVKAQ